MIGEVDKDGDREISYTEFANLMNGFKPGSKNKKEEKKKEEKK